MKTLIYFLAIVQLLLSCTQKKLQWEISGKITGADKITLVLQRSVGGEIVTLDSAVTRRGSFKMKGGPIDYPDMVALVAKEKKIRTTFYLENSRIKITGVLDSLYKATVTGSKTQDEYSAYLASMKILSDKYSDVINEYQAASQAGDSSKASGFEKQFESIQNQMITLQKDFLRNNPGSYVSPSILYGISFEMEADEIESFINSLDTGVAKTPLISELKSKVAVLKTVAIGQKAPDFTMNDVNGKPVTLSSKVGSKILIIDFWAAWCGPCRNENPNVVKVYKEFGKKGLEILGVSLDREKEDWTKAIADDNLTWTNVSDLQYWNNAAVKLYAVSSIPANFLLNDKGIIIDKNLTGDDLYKKVKEILETVK